MLAAAERSGLRPDLEGACWAAIAAPPAGRRRGGGPSSTWPPARSGTPGSRRASSGRPRRGGRRGGGPAWTNAQGDPPPLPPNVTPPREAPPLRNPAWVPTACTAAVDPLPRRGLLPNVYLEQNKRLRYQTVHNY